MEKIFCFIIVKINAPVIFHDNGYELRDYLTEKAVKEFVLAKIYTVSVHVDFKNQQITNITLEGDTHYD